MSAGEVYREGRVVVLRLPEDPTIEIRAKVGRDETDLEAAHRMLAGVMVYVAKQAAVGREQAAKGRTP